MYAGRRSAAPFSLGEKDAALVQKSDFAWGPGTGSPAHAEGHASRGGSRYTAWASFSARSAAASASITLESESPSSTPL